MSKEEKREEYKIRNPKLYLYSYSLSLNPYGPPYGTSPYLKEILKKETSAGLTKLLNYIDPIISLTWLQNWILFEYKHDTEKEKFL